MRSASALDRRPGWRRPVGYACLLLPVLAVLWVPVYARPAPALAGLPFFYWYQLTWVVLTPALMTAAYLLLHRRGTCDVGERAS